MTIADRSKQRIFWEKYGVFILFALFSALLLSVCSMCSFLFPIHNRADQNVFFTIGREMLHGKVIYRDLFEHKGPLTYFLHAFAASISSNSFIGLYLIECVSLTIFMIFAYKTARLLTDRINSFYAVLTVVTVMLCSNCFLRGDNVEELCWPLFMISVYYLLRARPFPYNPAPKAQSPLLYFVNGVLCGIVLWIKFNIIGFWIGWAIVALLPYLLQKKFKTFFCHSFLFLLGIAVTALPWLIYFAAKNALHDFFYTYFYCNIFLYKDDTGLLYRLLSIVIGIGRNLLGNVVLIASSVYGLVRFCKMRVYAPLITYIGLYAGVFFGGRWYNYYYLALAFYVLFGVVFFIEYLRKFRFMAWLRAHLVRGAAFAGSALFVLAILWSNCLPYYGAGRSEYPQFKFAEYIQNSNIENPTLLNYGFIDQGFYLAAGISPINKYFCRVNIPYSALPEMYDQQKKLIDQKSVDFVVVRIYGDGYTIKQDYISSITVAKKPNFQNPSYVLDADQVPLLFENYELIMEANDIYDSYVYGLFRKIQ